MSTSETVAPGIRSSDVAVGDWTLRVNETGDPTAPTILFLHGSGPGATAMSNWGGLLDELGTEFHCVAPDMVGFGDSTHPPDPPVGTGPFGQLRAEAIIGLIDVMDLRHITIVGNSMGGMVTLRLLATNPDCVERVVLMASGGAPVGAPTPELMKLVLFYEDPTTEAMADLMTCYVADPAVLDGRLDAIASERMPMARRDEVRRSHIATFTPVAAPMIDVEAVSRITQPVLAIHGREDRLIPVAGAYWFGEQIDDAQVHVLAHCGHWVQIEQRDRFVFLVRAFARGEI